MQLKDFKNHFYNSLSNIYPKTEIDTFFSILIEEYLKLKRIDIVLKPDFLIENEKLLQLKKALEKLQNEEPIQYIVGKTEFYGLPFLVDKNTLIPRPETEELVEWILGEVESREFEEGSEKISILDIGTGSGCIAISLAKNLNNFSISAFDISKKAIEVATKNAKLNSANVHFKRVDILKTKQLSKKYDIIVSNPPYVRDLEKIEIKNNVLQNEPHSALFVSDDNPLIFYDKISELAKQHLSKNGLLFFEINQYLGEETITLLKEKGYSNIELRKDLFGNSRMIKASL